MAQPMMTEDDLRLELLEMTQLGLVRPLPGDRWALTSRGYLTLWQDDLAREGANAMDEITRVRNAVSALKEVADALMQIAPKSVASDADAGRLADQMQGEIDAIYIWAETLHVAVLGGASGEPLLAG